MPTYVYECKSCEEQFESFEAMKDARKSTCPECQGELKLIPQGANFQFKGNKGDWYNNHNSTCEIEPSGNKPNRKKI